MILRQTNFLGQQRLDVPHLRAMESSVAADFDLLAGSIQAGDRPVVVKGLTIETTGAVGNPATSLQLLVAGSILMHPLASESGTIFAIPNDQAVEVLSTTNANVVGAFSAGQVNFIGLDLRREADDSTADLVAFYDANTKLETPKTVPLARTLSYRIVISTTEFTSTPNILPVAKVTTNASNVVTALEDARPMFFRLGSGGSLPDNKYGYPWAAGRFEDTTTNVFSGGDKGVTSLKDWMDAVMTRLWELGGGNYWYSSMSDRYVKLACTSNVLASTSDNFQWTLGSSTLEWKGLALLFGGDPSAWGNVVTDGTAVIPDGNCLYVDVNYDTHGASVTPAVAPLNTLGSPAVSGSRFVIAWRAGNDILVKDRPYEVGRNAPVATDLVFGNVKLKYAAVDPANPKVLAMQTGGGYVNSADSGNTAAFTGTGFGTGAGFDGTGGAGGGPGVKGTGGVGGGHGGQFIGTGAGSGLVAQGGGTDGSYAAQYSSVATNGHGIKVTATGTGLAGEFIAAAAGTDALKVTTGIFRAHQIEDSAAGQMLIGFDGARSHGVWLGNTSYGTGIYGNGIGLNGGDVSVNTGHVSLTATGKNFATLDGEYTYTYTKTLKKTQSGFNASVFATGGTPVIAYDVTNQRVGKSSGSGGSPAVAVAGQFSLPKGAIITAVNVKYSHAGSATESGYLTVYKLTPGAAGAEWTRVDVLNTSPYALTYGVGAQTGQETSPAVTATVADRTASNNNDIFYWQWTGLGTGYNYFVDIVVTYTSQTVLPDN